MPSSSPAHRHLQAIEAGQLSLLFAVEPEPPEATVVFDHSDKPEMDHHSPRPNIGRERRQSSSPPARAAEKIDTRGRKPVRKTAKQPSKTSIPSEMKVLVSREQAAEMLSISIRAVDYYIATKRLSTRRKGTRVLIPVEDIRKFARSDHPERMAG